MFAEADISEPKGLLTFEEFKGSILSIRTDATDDELFLEFEKADQDKD